MKKTTQRLLISLILVITMQTAVFASGTTPTMGGQTPLNRQNILNVGGTGPDNYTTIMSAIANASDGDTVFVHHDSSPYHEYIVIDKSITVIGENATTTLIEGTQYHYSTVKILADNVTFSRFTVENYPDRGIDLESNYSYITGNIVHNGDHGITVFSSNHNTIQGNQITNQTPNGIALWIDDSNDNLILDNSIHDNKGGIDLVTAQNNIITHNQITNNYITGINLQWDVSGNKVYDNTIANNQLGLSTGNELGPNPIYHNNFINNVHQAQSDHQHNWDLGYPDGGNYWSNYTGKDACYGQDQTLPGSDGIGDTNLTILGGKAQDRYPFIEPNGWTLNYPPIITTLTGKHYGQPGIQYSFIGSLFDRTPNQYEYVMFNWGDGSYSDWTPGTYNQAQANHSWSLGTYSITARAKDSQGATSNWSTPLTITIENTPPTLAFLRPDHGLYLRNKKILPRLLRPSLIIGTINITIAANDASGIQRVDFIIDNQLKATDQTPPYQYTWTKEKTTIIHRHTLIIIAYDNAGNTATIKTIIKKLL